MTNPSINIAENTTTVFITLDKAANTELAENALNFLRSLYQEYSRSMIEIEYVSDEEQREIDAILAAKSDEDKEIAFVEYDSIEL